MTNATGPDLRRRAQLKRLSVLLGAFLSGALGVPLVGAAVGASLRRADPPWLHLGAAGDFEVGRPRFVTVGVTKQDGYLRTTIARAVWVYRLAEDRLVVYNARCTHLGCLVNYRAESQTFLSPCHGGLFALGDGRVLDGPPPRPLDRLEHRVDDGQLLVQYQDFLLGVPNQSPL